MPIRALLPQLTQDPAFNQLLTQLEAAPPLHLGLSGLWGSGRAFFWAGLRERLQCPMLLVLPTADEARTLYEQLRLFLEHPDPEREDLLFFPSREVLPYEHALVDMDLEGERLEVLLRLAEGSSALVVTAIEQVREVLPPPAWLRERRLLLTVGQHQDLDRLAEALVEHGYSRVPQVESRGEFAVRGGIVDIYPPADLAPWRVEFEGTEIVSLRRFNLSAEESAPAAPVTEVQLGPGRLFALSPEELKRGLARIDREHGRERAKDLREALAADPGFPGAEHYAAYFMEPADLFDYLSPATIVVIDSPGAARSESEAQQLRAEQLFAEHRRREPLLPAPSQLFRPFERVAERGSAFAWVESGRLRQSVWPETEGGWEASVVLKGTTPLRGSLELLVREAQALLDQGLAVQVVSHNRAEEQRLRQVLAERAVELAFPDLLGRLSFHLGQLSEGFQYPACHLAVFTDQEIFNRKLARPRLRRSRGAAYPSQPLSDVLELQPGDLAVHRDHGIAYYQGVVKLEVDGGEQEFIRLAYADEQKLYVPMDQLRLMEKYIGAEAPRVHRLGSGSWDRTKERIKAEVTELARQLLDIYASRQVHPGHAFGPDTPMQREFEEAFPYEETPDQVRAINEVKRDLQSPRPMDRLICGDVGFGKTEVAMRAAFKVVQEGFQVAVLVPTTILADQHFATFRERMAAYPVRIELLSRFKSAPEQKALLADLARGAIDIVIGTHRVLAKDVAFPRLGLCVVDEEQHFGVAQKEKLKKLRATIDVITLTATPIPRTLYLSLSGIRDLSVIETPPLNRLAIRTFVMEYSESVIREGILRELARGGQVFFIHNRVASIGPMAERLKRLVPEARIAIAHGQMTRDQLEPVMERFLARAEDILVSTTIVESGLDMPNVNTIVINRADALGVAQLYQLRGRVGRADRQAYAYLFYPLGGAVTGDAEKRLTTLQEFTELGSGIKIAMRDLEIRGAGDVLGPEQSGAVAAVGFETYVSLLEEAVRELRGQAAETAPAEVTVSIPLDAFLPTDYVPDTAKRLNWYKRLAGALSVEDLMGLRTELEGGFGRIPQPTLNLLAVAEIKLLARAAQVREVKATPQSLIFRWPERYRPAPGLVEKLLADRTRRLRFVPGEQVGLEVSRPAGDLLTGVKNVLSELI